MAFNIENAVFEDDGFSPEKSSPKRGASVAETPLAVSKPTSELATTQTTGAFDLSRAEFLEEAPQRTERQIAQKNLQEQFSPIPPSIVDNVLTPLFEIGRGAFLGVSDVADTANSVSEFIGSISGTKTGGFFEKIAQEQGNIAQNIPETGASGFAKTVYQLAGQIPAIVTEFGLVKTPKFFNKLFKEASMVQKFAVLEGLDEFAKEKAAGGEGLEQAEAGAKGVAKGATIALTFGILGNATKILHSGNKKLAGAYIAFTTGNKELGADFANNPRKYNVNPLSGKTKSVSQVREENAKIKQDLSIKIGNEKADFKNRSNIKKENLKDKVDKEQVDLAATNDELKTKLRESSEISLKEGADKAAAATKRKNESIQAQAVNFYDNALSTFVLIRKQAGEAVGAAVNATINRNPLAAIPFKLVNDPFKATIKKFSPFEIKARRGGGQTAVQKTAISNKQDLNTFQTLLDDFNSKKAQGGLSVKYLQDLKNDLKNLSTQAYKGQTPNTQLGKLYSELSNDVNPATLVSRNKQLTKELSEIADANREFASLVPKYEAAMKFYFKEVNGNFVPAPEKAIRAIATNDVVAIRQMKSADKLLNKGDELFPTMQEMSRQADKAAAQEKGMVKSLKIALNREKSELAAATKKAQQELRSKNNKLKSTQRDALADEINKFNEGKQLEHNAITNELAAQEKFASQQEQLRNFAGSTKTPAGIIQRVAAFGVLLPKATGDPSSAVLPLMAVLGLSPSVSSNLTKATLTTTGSLDAILGGIMRGEGIKKLGASKIAEQFTGAQIGSRLAVTPEGKDALDSVLGR